MKQFTSPTQRTGLSGEHIATDYLKYKGFTILERNYTKKIGEIDIIAEKEGKLHFVEVKTLVKYGSNFNPFENLTPFKLRKLVRMVQWYLLERRVPRETLWFIDAIAIEINREARSAKVNVMWNIT